MIEFFGLLGIIILYIFSVPPTDDTLIAFGFIFWSYAAGLCVGAMRRL